MSNVVTSLDALRKSKAYEKFVQQGDPKDLFSIPWDDIIRGSDSANTSKSDPVLLGPKAEMAVRRLFTEFGIKGWPTTWGELMGAVWYCRIVYSQGQTFEASPKDIALWLAIGLRLVEKHSPELAESVVAYRNADLATLQKVSTDRLTLAVMSEHFDHETGWVSQVPTMGRRESELHLAPKCSNSIVNGSPEGAGNP
jgi:hypothetical protein